MRPQLYYTYLRRYGGRVMTRHFNLADLFEMVIDVVPEREASICGDKRITYAQLEERANRLAHYLSEQGVKAGDHVACFR